jgi:hypothetical protein
MSTQRWNREPSPWPDVPGPNTAAATEFWERSFGAALDRRATLIRVVGEMACEREQFSSEAETLAYEPAFNLIVKRFPCLVVCQYDVREFSGEALFAALRAHPDLLGLPLRTLTG